MTTAPARLRLERWWGAAASVVVAAGFGLYHLGSRSLWGDEAFSITLAREPIGEFWRVVSRSQANMSLYYFLLRGWTVFGDGESVIRLLSLLAGVLAVAVFYAAAERLFDRRVAMLASLLLAVNGFFLRYAQEARSYALVLLLTTAATLLFLLAVERSEARGLDLAYVVVAALALYAHFFAVFVLAGHLFVLAVTRRPARTQLLRLAAVAVLTVPLAVFALFRDAGQISHFRRPTPAAVHEALRQLAGGNRYLLVLYALAVVVGAVHWLRYPRWWRDWAMVNTAVWAAFPIACALIVSVAKPVFAPRFFIVALPGIVLFVTVGLMRLPRPLALTTVALLLALSCVHAIRTQGEPQEDFRAATAFLLANARRGDTVAFYRSSRRIPFEYYARRNGKRTLPPSLFPSSPYGHFDLVTDYRHTRLTTQELARISAVASRARVWLLLSKRENESVREKQLNRARLIAAVEMSGRLRERHPFAGLEVRLYEPR